MCYFTISVRIKGCITWGEVMYDLHLQPITLSARSSCCGALLRDNKDVKVRLKYQERVFFTHDWRMSYLWWGHGCGKRSYNRHARLGDPSSDVSDLALESITVNLRQQEKNFIFLLTKRKTKVLDFSRSRKCMCYVMFAVIHFYVEVMWKSGELVGSPEVTAPLCCCRCSHGLQFHGEVEAGERKQKEIGTCAHGGVCETGLQHRAVQWDLSHSVFVVETVARLGPRR